MKTFKIFFPVLLLMTFSFTVSAQDTTEKFKVSGNCGMCKNKIEKAAKEAGATYAMWDEDSKMLEVKYNSTSTNAAKIQEKIAASGYDNVGAKASDEAYNKLHGCCKYERSEASTASCCNGDTCTKEECKTCCVDGKCTKSMDCCSDGKCTMHEKKKSKKTKSKA
jgi:periplasmic mercuric ion binding protein